MPMAHVHVSEASLSFRGVVKNLCTSIDVGSSSFYSVWWQALRTLYPEWEGLWEAWDASAGDVSGTGRGGDRSGAELGSVATKGDRNQMRSDFEDEWEHV